MSVFAYKGIDARGKSVKGVKDADSPKALRAILKRDGVLVTEILEKAEAAQRSAREVDFKKIFQRLNTMEVAIATRQLAVLLKAGIPLVQGLTALIDQVEHPELKTAFTEARDRVNEGSSFADSLKLHPKIFKGLFVSMVAAGEASGNLDTVLARLADFLESQARLKGKVGGALAYPAVMLVVTIGLMLMMMTVVVPKLTNVFEDFSQSLPWYTRLLIFTSDVIMGYWWLLGILFTGLVMGFRNWLSTKEGRAKWDDFTLRIPLFGKLLVMVAVTRFCRTLATLLASGVPVLRAMEITRDVLGNVKLMGVIDEARESVREGQGLAKHLKESGVFPPIVTHMIAIGESSGELEAMLENVASAYEQQVDVRVQAMSSLLEPLIIVVMGVLVGGIAFAILMPLLQITEFAQ